MTFRARIIICSLALILPAGLTLQAADSQEEKQLETDRQTLDKSAATDSRKVDTLAKQYNVTPETVQGLRDKGQGWGEASIGLATAQELAKKDPTTYPTIGDALTKVEAMRADGAGWGKIAKDLGFKLGPVVSASRHTRNELRSEASGHSSESSKETMHPEHSAKPEHTGKPDFAGKPEHAGKPDFAGKPDHPSH